MKHDKMTYDETRLSNRIIRSIKGHLRVALIALVFGMTAYGLIHLLILAVRTVENL
ncbi:MAG: hypothetical protein JKY45_08750 [Emcibacter sp.]|nr:hypothetical protein [Emcibacter sp.]